MAGIEHLKQQVKLIEIFGDLLAAASEDDGKLSASDLFDKDVLGSLYDLVKAGKSFYDNHDAILEEAKDLDAFEAIQLVQHYLNAWKVAYGAAKLIVDRKHEEDDHLVEAVS